MQETWFPHDNDSLCVFTLWKSHNKTILNSDKNETNIANILIYSFDDNISVKCEYFTFNELLSIISCKNLDIVSNIFSLTEKLI